MGLNSFLPFIILLVLNCLIILTLRNRERDFHADLNPQSTTVKSSNQTIVSANYKEEMMREKVRDRQLTVMLLLVSFALIVFTLPLYLRVGIYSFIDYRQSVLHYANYHLIFLFSSMCMFANNATNFFLYCLGGSRFRQDAIDIIQCKFKRTR